MNGREVYKHAAGAPADYPAAALLDVVDNANHECPVGKCRAGVGLVAGEMHDR